MWPLCSLRCDTAQNSLALRKTASIGHSKGVPTPVAPSPNRKQAMKTSCCWGRGRVVQVRVSSDLAFQSHGYQFCKEDIVHKSANKVFGGGGTLRQEGGTILDICGGVCPLLFPLGNCFFSVLGGSDGFLIIEPHSLALLVHLGYYNEVP